jgi:hypothetical protein
LIASEWRGSGHENFITLPVSFFMPCNNMCAGYFGVEVRPCSFTLPCVKQTSERKNACALLSFGTRHLLPAGNLTVFHGIGFQKMCNLYTQCHEKIKSFEERTFPFFPPLLWLDQFPVAQTRNKPFGLDSPNKQITLWRGQVFLINFPPYF